MTVKLTDIMHSVVTELKRYDRRLKVGVYHMTDFRVMANPKTLKRTAYIDCLEGKYWTVSTPIIRELDTELGEKIRPILKSNDIEIEIIPYRTERGRIWGEALLLEPNTVIDQENTLPVLAKVQ